MKVINPQQVEEKKQRILDAALTIIQEEGIDGLSIRKIASRIQQTPGIIYHYYKDKDAILEAIVMSGYKEILATLQTADIITSNAKDTLYQTLTMYIELMIKKGDVFFMLMNSRNPHIAGHIDLLEKNIRSKRKSMDMLCHVIEDGIKQGIFYCEHIELRAQCIWTSVYGLLTRLLLEQPDIQQQERLIEEELQFILSSLMK